MAKEEKATAEDPVQVSVDELRLPRQTPVLHDVGFRAGGYVIRWNDKNPVNQTYFAPDTKFELVHDRYPILINNGMDSESRRDIVGWVDYIDINQTGVYIVGSFDHKSKWYVSLLMQFNKGRLIYAASNAPHLQEVGEDGKILSYWPVEFSVRVLEQTINHTTPEEE